MAFASFLCQSGGSEPQFGPRPPRNQGGGGDIFCAVQNWRCVSLLHDIKKLRRRRNGKLHHTRHFPFSVLLSGKMKKNHSHSFPLSLIFCENLFFCFLRHNKRLWGGCFGMSKFETLCCVGRVRFRIRGVKLVRNNNHFPPCAQIKK